MSFIFDGIAELLHWQDLLFHHFVDYLELKLRLHQQIPLQLLGYPAIVLFEELQWRLQWLHFFDLVNQESLPAAFKDNRLLGGHCNGVQLIRHIPALLTKCTRRIAAST
jgi:lipid-A-disaccharide synthase-like uncharacterized protein